MADQLPGEATIVNVNKEIEFPRERSMPITVLLTDDADVIRKAIRKLLDSDPEIKMVGEAASFRQAVQSSIDLKPHIVVMDVHLPDDAAVKPQEIRSLFDTIGSRLIAISVWNDEETYELAKKFGAVTLVDKMKLYTELIPAIKGAATNGAAA